MFFFQSLSTEHAQTGSASHNLKQSIGFLGERWIPIFKFSSERKWSTMYIVILKVCFYLNFSESAVGGTPYYNGVTTGPTGQ